MTKKDYIKFADMLATSKVAIAIRQKELKETTDFLAGSITQYHIIKQNLIAIFKFDNPNFNEDRFNQYIEKRVKSLLE